MHMPDKMHGAANERNICPKIHHSNNRKGTMRCIVPFIVCFSRISLYLQHLPYFEPVGCLQAVKLQELCLVDACHARH